VVYVYVAAVCDTWVCDRPETDGERRFYQKLTDIYATSIDYNRDAPTTRAFFKKVQNKMYYAVHGHTAADLIVDRAICFELNGDKFNTFSQIYKIIFIGLRLGMIYHT